ncbi:MAG: hypothetical protein Q8P72_00910, partial [Candidatus Roizmanbacteria bacterium]|nr:hypothetical protein [Candidatus Roizmanbacteria bacterium]
MAIDFFRKFVEKYLTDSVRTREISETRAINGSENREMDKPFDSAQGKLIMESFHCPYCGSLDFVKRGFRQKKREKIQLYLCSSCQKTFTPYSTKGKRYPMAVVIDAISIYNLGYSLETTCRIMNQRTSTVIPAQAGIQSGSPIGVGDDKRGILPPSTLTDWLSEFAELCRFSRMRAFALKKYSPKDMVISATLAHRQLYRFRFHRAKCELVIKDDFKHRRFGPLQEFLEMVPTECPHQYYQVGLRASEAPLTFSKTQMIVRAKQNYANKL